MTLHPILKERKCINILKVLYDNEVLNKKYSMGLSLILKRLSISDPSSALLLLAEKGLITTDEAEDEKILSITNKGKEFIEAFDHLVEVVEGKRQKPKSVFVRYELTTQEKKILVLSYNISKEIGSDFISVKALVMEMFPHHDYNSRVGIVSKSINRLVDLNLIEKLQQNDVNYIKVTLKGIKTIDEQHLRGIVY